MLPLLEGAPQRLEKRVYGSLALMVALNRVGTVLLPSSYTLVKMGCFRLCALFVDYRETVVTKSKSQLNNDYFYSRVTLKACGLTFSLFDTPVLMLIKIWSCGQGDTVPMQSMRG